MNINQINFLSNNFWNQHYLKNKFSTLDWYFDLTKIKLSLFSFSEILKESEILVIGIGTSSIIEYFLINSYEKIIFIDNNKLLIDHLAVKYEKAVSWLFGCFDISSSEQFKSNLQYFQFDVIFDKGLLDMIYLNDIKYDSFIFNETILNLSSSLNVNGSLLYISVIDSEIMIEKLSLCLADKGFEIKYEEIGEDKLNMIGKDEVYNFFMSEDNLYFAYLIIRTD